MPLRPNQTVNLIVASVALALLAEGALLWQLSSRARQQNPAISTAPIPAAPALTPGPVFVAPSLETAPAIPPFSAPDAVPAPQNPLVAPAKSPAPADAQRAEARRFFDIASQALQRKDAKTALENFRRVAQIAPDNLPTRLNLALLYLSANQPAQAIPHLQKAAQLDPKSAAPRFQLAQAYLALRKPALALAPLQETVRIAPDEPQARVLLAQVYTAQKRYGDAYKQWSALAQKQPRDVEAHLQAAALASDALKQPREAEKWLRRAQTATPKDPRSALLLGRLLLGTNQPKSAAQALGVAAKARPDVFEIYPMLADARQATGDLAGARNALQSALLRLPVAKTAAQKAQMARAQGDLRLALGRVLGQSKQHRAAQKEFGRAAALLPRQAEPQALLAIAALQSRDVKTAEAALKRAIAIDPKRTRERLTLAQILAEKRNFRAAETQYAAYAKAQPRDLAALNQWAQVTLQLGPRERALPILAQISRLDPKNPTPLMQSGAILRDAKRLAPALTQFERALARRPNDASALFEVARLQTTLKRAGAALAWQKLIARQPDYAPAYSALLEASARNGDGTAARLFLARQLGQGADNPRALSEILRFYERSGRAPEARALLSDIAARNPRAKSARAALDSFTTTPVGAPSATPVATATTPKTP